MEKKDWEKDFEVLFGDIERKDYIKAFIQDLLEQELDKEFEKGVIKGRLEALPATKELVDKARAEGWEKGRELADLDWEESELVVCLLPEQKKRQKELREELSKLKSKE